MGNKGSKVKYPNSHPPNLDDKSNNLIEGLKERGKMYIITIVDKSIDSPIIYASNRFCKFTQYPRDYVVGRNCRFLQGKNTNRADVKKIRDAIANELELSIKILNYKKDGTPFGNHFFMTPMYEKGQKKAKYFLGVQSVLKDNPGDFESQGWEDDGLPPQAIIELRKGFVASNYGKRDSVDSNMSEDSDGI